MLVSRTVVVLRRLHERPTRYEQMLVPLADEIGRVLYKKRDPLFLHKHYNAAYPVLSVLEDSMNGK